MVITIIMQRVEQEKNIDSSISVKNVKFFFIVKLNGKYEIRRWSNQTSTNSKAIYSRYLITALLSLSPLNNHVNSIEPLSFLFWKFCFERCISTLMYVSLSFARSTSKKTRKEKIVFERSTIRGTRNRNRLLILIIPPPPLLLHGETRDPGTIIT